MGLTLIYILFVIVYSILIYLGFSLLEDSNVLKNKGKRKKVNVSKKYFGIFIFIFLYVILIVNSYYMHHLVVIALLLYSTLLFFIMFAVKRFWLK